MQYSFILICFLVLPLQAISATCSSLALAFSKDPHALTLDDLSALRKCVNDELRAKANTIPEPPPSLSKPKPGLPSK